MYRILLVDNDPHILRTNEAFLKRQGYEVIAVNNGSDAIQTASVAALDAMVLDVDMPGTDGFIVCNKLREVNNVPIIFLSAYARTDDRIRRLMAEGDDYIAKPHSMKELALRLRLRIQRRYHTEIRKALRFGELEIDPGLREVRYKGNTAAFTSLEFNLLIFLAQNPGQAFACEQLYDRVWKETTDKGVHNLQICMARLRQKLDKLCLGRHYIEAVRGEGYRFLIEPKI